MGSNRVHCANAHVCSYSSIDIDSLLRACYIGYIPNTLVSHCATGYVAFQTTDIHISHQTNPEPIPSLPHLPCFLPSFMVSAFRFYYSVSQLIPKFNCLQRVLRFLMPRVKDIISKERRDKNNGRRMRNSHTFMVKRTFVSRVYTASLQESLLLLHTNVQFLFRLSTAPYFSFYTLLIFSFPIL